MTEERVTLAVMKFIRNFKYAIIAFDYPQSGRGLLLHSNERRGKNDDSLVPDILAKRADDAIFLENKVRFSDADAAKLRRVRDSGLYDGHLRKVGIDRQYCKVKFGVALADTPSNVAAFMAHGSDLDLLFLVDAKGRVTLRHGSMVD